MGAAFAGVCVCGGVVGVVDCVVVAVFDFDFVGVTSGAPCGGAKKGFSTRDRRTREPDDDDDADDGVNDWDGGAAA